MEDGPGAGLATTRSSVDSNGFQATNHSWDPVVSRDGLFVAFDSNADDLVVGDTNTKRDVFVRDVLAGMTTRVSVGDDGSQASDHSDCASISADGELAGFTSAAADLVDGDLNTKLDVFVHHRSTGHAVRVHLAWDGSEADAESRSAVLTSSGSHVVFDSKATNLVVGDGNGKWDVFLRSVHPEPTLVGVSPSSGSSGGGQAVTLTGFATNEAGAPVVTFDGVPATITCDTPAGTPGAVDVTIANNNGAATLVAGYSYF